VADDDGLDELEFLPPIGSQPEPQLSFTADFGDVAIEDNEELPPLEDEPIVGDGECKVCGAPTFRPPGLTKGGQRRRAPKFCDLHNPKAPRPPLVGGSLGPDLAKIQEELGDDIRLLGILAGPLFPTTGYYVTENADQFTVALLKLAKNNQRILRVLHRAAQVAPVYTVAEFVAGTAYSVQVDTGRADPHSTIAKRIGVSRAYDAVHIDSNSNGNNVTSNGMPTPPHYATVQ